MTDSNDTAGLRTETHGAHEILVKGTTEMELKEIQLCKRILDKLNEHYAGHSWHVKVDYAQGIATLILLYPDRLGRIKPCGVLMHILSLDSDVGLKTVMRYGGELLERFGLPRSKASVDAALIARQKVVDLAGMVR